MLYREWTKGRSNKVSTPSKVAEVATLWQVMKLGELTVYNCLRLLEEWAVYFDATACKAARASIPWHSYEPDGEKEPDHGSLIADLLTINSDEEHTPEAKALLSRQRADEELKLQHSKFPNITMYKQLMDMFEGRLDATLKAEVLDTSGTLLVSPTTCKMSELSMVICFSFPLGL